MIEFKPHGDSLVHVIAFCPDACDDLLAGHLMIGTDDYWWFYPAASSPPLPAGSLIRITNELGRLNAGRALMQPEVTLHDLELENRMLRARNERLMKGGVQ